MLYSILTVPSIRSDARTMVIEVAHAVETIIYVLMKIDYLDIVLICVIFVLSYTLSLSYYYWLLIEFLHI